MSWLIDLLTRTPRYQGANCWEWAEALQRSAPGCREAFQAMGPRSAAGLIAVFAQANRDGNKAADDAALDILVSMGAGVLPEVVAGAFRAPEDYTRLRCAQTLLKFNEQGWQALRKALHISDDPAQSVPQYLETLRTLTPPSNGLIWGALAKLGAEAVPALIKAVADTQGVVRCTAVDALRHYAATDERALGAVLQISLRSDADLEKVVGDVWKELDQRIVDAAWDWTVAHGQLQETLVGRLARLCGQSETARRRAWAKGAAGPAPARQLAVRVFEHCSAKQAPAEIDAAMHSDDLDLRQFAHEAKNAFGAAKRREAERRQEEQRREAERQRAEALQAAKMQALLASSEFADIVNDLCRLVAAAPRLYDQGNMAGYGQTQQRIKSIGQRLCDLAGDPLMQAVAERVRQRGGSVRQLELSWNGIGGWQF